MYAIGTYAQSMYTPYITRHQSRHSHLQATRHSHLQATRHSHLQATRHSHLQATRHSHLQATRHSHLQATRHSQDKPDITHQSQNQGYSNTNTVSVTEPFQVSLTQSRSQVSTNSSRQLLASELCDVHTRRYSYTEYGFAMMRRQVLRCIITSRRSPVTLRLSIPTASRMPAMAPNARRWSVGVSNIGKLSR